MCRAGTKMFVVVEDGTTMLGVSPAGSTFDIEPAAVSARRLAVVLPPAPLCPMWYIASQQSRARLSRRQRVVWPAQAVEPRAKPAADCEATLAWDDDEAGAGAGAGADDDDEATLAWDAGEATAEAGGAPKAAAAPAAAAAAAAAGSDDETDDEDMASLFAAEKASSPAAQPASPAAAKLAAKPVAKPTAAERAPAGGIDSDNESTASVSATLVPLPRPSSGTHSHT